ncbi:pyridine nucleotide-disulfide oxidoreductase domain-containing protein 1 isoform X1 [Dermacentor albipictus]|uniref:pyridine nucleotide-disulfide oxidoreductase domain-containing protein 1 isoform X1 n=1 Tax=Dermacentor albipictus TaxID=60249 RepID=UPI0031FC25C2
MRKTSSNMEALKNVSDVITGQVLHLKSTFVVIGGGIAGVSCAEQLAVHSPEESVLLITASPIVKAATNVVKLRRIIESFDIEERSFNYLEQQYSNIKVLQDVLISLEASERATLLKSGRVVSYGMICLCMGARPQLISKDNPLVLGIRDTETVRMLQNRLGGARLVAVIGNGGIATELVHEMGGCQVLWVVREKSIGATFFDPGAAQFFLPQLSAEKSESTASSAIAEQDTADCGDSKCPSHANQDSLPPGSALGPDWAKGRVLQGGTQKNVHIEYSCEVRLLLTPAEFKQKCLADASCDFKCGSNWPIYVLLTNDKCFGVDLIVSATGVTPNADTITAPQLEVATDGGILVDRQMRSSLAGVYAAGDVCTAGWEPAELWFQRRLWTQARQMGHWAGTCMAAHWSVEPDPLADARFDLFSHVTRFFGYRVVLLGIFNGQGLADCRALVRVNPGQEYIKLLLHDGRLKGAVLIGDTDLEETCENLLLDQLDLGPLADHLLDPEVDIEDFFD